jgi:hypothetical protein
MYFGFIKTIVNFLSLFYTLWLAVLIKQILKDPIHRLNRYMILYHFLTVLACVLLSLYVSRVNGYGVEVSPCCCLRARKHSRVGYSTPLGLMMNIYCCYQ